ncbi:MULTISPECIES: hypothetical protein [unclassified Bradyrhizobium]
MTVTVRSISSTAYQSSTNTVLPPPSGLANGDVLTAIIAAGQANTETTITAPAGFAQVAGAVYVSETGFCVGAAVFQKRASGESGNYTFITNGGVACTQQGLLIASQGALATGSPIDGASANGGSSQSTSTTDFDTWGTDATAEAITTAAANSMVLFLSSTWGDLSGSISPPTGFTEIYDAGIIYAAWKIQGSAGSSGDVTTQVNPGFAPWTAFLVGIAQAADFVILGDRAIDNGLAALRTDCDKIYVCSQTPTSFTEATSTYAVGNKNWGAGNAFGSPGAKSGGGRQVSSNAITDGAITTNGAVGAWAAVDSVNSRLLAAGSLSGGKAVTAGQVFTLGVVTVGLPKS